MGTTISSGRVIRSCVGQAGFMGTTISSGRVIRSCVGQAGFMGTTISSGRVIRSCVGQAGFMGTTISSGRVIRSCVGQAGFMGTTISSGRVIRSCVGQAGFMGTTISSGRVIRSCVGQAGFMGTTISSGRVIRSCVGQAGFMGTTISSGRVIRSCVVGGIKSDDLSEACAAALHNVSLTATGKQALIKYMAGLVEALQPGHACHVAQLALDTVGVVVASNAAGPATVLQHVAALAHVVHRRLARGDCEAKMQQSYVALVQHLLRAAEGVALFSQPEVLDQLLTLLQVQFAGGVDSPAREAAGSCIEALATAALDNLWAVQQWQLHKRLVDAAEIVKAAARAARQAAEWRAAMQDLAATCPTADACLLCLQPS
ncbi:hypothetical protein COO60DRAFT_1457856 [Scenedesmus sp. NREL 46B-D3]|nr:hypothetical protein COO60DRAFT_1457856 [Scenedesmus sp. NREL 46B-D3]